MAKPLILIVHGMGTHSKASVLKEFRDGIKAALALYEDFSHDDFEGDVELKPVVYSDLIDKHRNAIAAKSGALSGALAGIGGNLSLVSGAAATIDDIDSRLGDDDFFFTHWLDVIVYRFTLLGEPMQIAVAEAIADALTTGGRSSKDIHVVAHSLGTSVTHDALAKIYGANQFADPNLPKLNPGTSTLGSRLPLTVSRTAWSATPTRPPNRFNVGRSLVRTWESGPAESISRTMSPRSVRPTNAGPAGRGTSNS